MRVFHQNDLESSKTGTLGNVGASINGILFPEFEVHVVMKTILTLGLLLLGSMAFAADKKPDIEEAITVKVIGTLRTGIVAIGGETTGTTITAKNITWELDFGKNAQFRKLAENMNGKKVIIQGSLEKRKGVEIKERWIVHVTKLKAADSNNQEADLSAVGPNKSSVRFDVEDTKSIIDIQSKTGIGNIQIHRQSETWPKMILVRLHLKGLESFKAKNDEVAIQWSVSSGGNNPSRVTLWKGRDELSLGDNSPYFTKVRLVGNNKAIPLRKGCFEVPLPSKFLEDNPKMIELSWIDFYRG